MPHNEDRFGLPYKCKWQLHWLQKQQTENINTSINTQIWIQRVAGSHTQEHKRGHQGALIKIKDLETDERTENNAEGGVVCDSGGGGEVKFIRKGNEQRMKGRMWKF